MTLVHKISIKVCYPHVDLSLWAPLSSLTLHLSSLVLFHIYYALKPLILWQIFGIITPRNALNFTHAPKCSKFLKIYLFLSYYILQTHLTMFLFLSSSFIIVLHPCNCLYCISYQWLITFWKKLFIAIEITNYHGWKCIERDMPMEVGEFCMHIHKTCLYKECW